MAEVGEQDLNTEFTTAVGEMVARAGEVIRREHGLIPDATLQCVGFAFVESSVRGGAKPVQVMSPILESGDSRLHAVTRVDNNVSSAMHAVEVVDGVDTVKFEDKQLTKVDPANVAFSLWANESQIGAKHYLLNSGGISVVGEPVVIVSEDMRTLSPEAQLRGLIRRTHLDGSAGEINILKAVITASRNLRS